MLSFLLAWTYISYPTFPTTILSSLLIVSGVFFFNSIVLPPPTCSILQSQVSRIIPTLLTGFGIAFFALLLFRIDYSRPILLMGGMLSCIWYISFYTRQEAKWKATLYLVGDFQQSHDRLAKKLTLKPYVHTMDLSRLKGGILVDIQTPFTEKEEGIIADCSIAQIPVYHISQLQERLDHKVSSMYLSDSTIRALQPYSGYFRIKSVLDFVIAILAIIITSPLMAIICLLIKSQGSGSVFFKQTRVGQNNQAFTLYKFRTMRTETRSDTAKFASEEPERISKLGRILRHSRLDELPQFWNVLKGDMSIIGPRPEQPIFAKQFAKEIPFYDYRHIVKPGITGWAQVTQGYTDNTESTKEKLAYDFYYLKYLSWQLDFEIYLKTLRVMWIGKGAA